MELYEACDFVYNTLRASKLENTVIVKAFPYTDKRARLEKTVIAVKSGELERKAVSIGESVQYGTVTIKAEVYTPLRLGADELCKRTEAAVKAVAELEPSAISISPIEANDVLGGLHCSCSFTFCSYYNETD